MSNGSSNGNPITSTLKALLASPVGGWALAVIAIGIMAWLTVQDRQVIYEDLARLRRAVADQISEGVKVVKENNELLQENQRILNDINRKLTPTGDLKNH